MTDICIIGAGPAGLTAALYALRSGKKVIVVEENSYGGQIINTPEIENYPAIDNISGFDFATSLYNQCIKFGMNIQYDKVNAISQKDNSFFVGGMMNSYEAGSVIIATGVKRRKLGVEGEERLIGRGVSYCATCDGAFFKGKDVAVIGGGNTALSEALFLSNYCSKVYLIHRRDEFRGEKNKLQLLKNKTNVSIITDVIINSILGEDKVQGIEYTHKNTKKQDVVKVSGVFVAVGQLPDVEFLRNTIDLNNEGYIDSDEQCMSKIPGIFVAGDCRKKDVRQLTTATADGTVAAIKACEFIDTK